jgi:acyl dehydratase
MAITARPPIAVGDLLPEFSRAASLETWNRYAAVNYEFVPIHMDDEAGQAAGYPGAFAMGNLSLTYLHNAIRDWIGDDGRIVRLSCQFRLPTLRGMTVTVRGIVTGIEVEDGTSFVDLDIWLEDQDGNRLTPGTATVALDAQTPS